MAATSFACTGVGQDVESPTTTVSSAPDVSGIYLADWSDDGACGALAGFVTGPLEITGPPEALALDFTEATFGGAIDETFTFTVSGTAALDDGSVTVEGEGLAYVDDELWVLSGELLMDAEDASGTTCTSGGTLIATQLGAGSE